MKLRTTIVPRRDGTVIADFRDVTYTFAPDEFGVLVGVVDNGPHADHLIGTGNFFPHGEVAKVPHDEREQDGGSDGGSDGDDDTGQSDTLAAAPGDMSNEALRAEIEARTGDKPRAKVSRDELIARVTELRQD